MVTAGAVRGRGRRGIVWRTLTHTLAVDISFWWDHGCGCWFMGGLLYGLASSQPGGGETERERKEEAVFLLWPDLRGHSVIPTVLYRLFVLSHFSRDPMDCSPPGSSVHGIPQARILEWVAISFSSGSSRPRNQTCVSYISCLGRWILCHQSYLGSPFYWLEPCN